MSSRSQPPIAVAEQDRQVPVTVVCGFHGAGKSALISHLQACPEAGRVRVVSGGLGERRELAAIRSDILWAEVDGIARDERPDHLLVEVGGGQEPRQFAEALGGTLDGNRRCGLARLDTMLTVADATSVLELCGPVDRLDVSERAFVHHCVPSRGDVVAEQIEFADILVVNKVDLVGEDDLWAIVALLRILNPVARILQPRQGIVPTREVLATNRFDVTRTAGVAGWMAAMRGEPLPDVAGSASTSFVYRARRPFDAERLWRLLKAPWSGMLRAKGIFWLAQRSDLMGNWSQVGRALTLETTRDWWAALPLSRWPAPAKRARVVDPYWQPPYGDRRQHIAFIGASLNESAIRDDLDTCLLRDFELELGETVWSTWPDPLADRASAMH